MGKQYATLEDLKLELWLRKRNAGGLVWITKNGLRIPLKDMTDSHLENAIRKEQEFQELKECTLENYVDEDAWGDR